MRPYLVELLNRLSGTEVFTCLVPNSTIVLALTVIAGALLGARLAARRGLDPGLVYGAVLWSFPVGWLGARLLHVVYAADTYRGGPLRFFDPLQGDAVSYGGVIAGLGCALIYLRRQRAPIGACLDLAAPLIGLGIAAGRLGCLLDGCDFGTRTACPLAVRFPPGSPASIEQAQLGWLAHPGLPSLPVHPVQLYLSAGALAIALWILRWQRRHPDAVPGRSFALFWLLYAVSRFAWELLRGDVSRGFVGALSTSQAISIPVAVAALVWLWLTRRPAARRAPA
ncbi:MAG: prolipoprotein diacylglyceryl transferase [bacterium]|nr:prolipoprotein diacylglyceryl transferase [bacterium]